MTMKERIIVVGSGPSAPKVISAPLHEFDVVVLNNAWSLLPVDKIDCWMKSTDFRGLATHIPDDETWEKLEAKSVEWKNKNCWKTGRVLHAERNKSTVFLGAVGDIFTAGPRRWKSIWFVGCEHDYSSSNTHFYGNGTPDPLRFGDDFLVTQFRVMRDYANSHGIRLIDMSENRNGLLWKVLHE